MCVEALRMTAATLVIVIPLGLRRAFPNLESAATISKLRPLSSFGLLCPTYLRFVMYKCYHWMDRGQRLHTVDGSIVHHMMVKLTAVL